jgi:hypothetical protein
MKPRAHRPSYTQPPPSVDSPRAKAQAVMLLVGARRSQLDRMAKYHPTVKIVLIEKRQYSAIKNSVGRLIEGWES